MTDNIVSEIVYIYNSSKLITKALQQGQDVVQFCNGDIITTKITVTNTEYKWDPQLGQITKVNDAV